MATRSRQMNFDVTTLLDHAASQFRGLNAREPGQWPALPKLAAWFGAAVAVVVVGWFALLSGAADELQTERDREPTHVCRCAHQAFSPVRDATTGRNGAAVCRIFVSR